MALVFDGEAEWGLVVVVIESFVVGFEGYAPAGAFVADGEVDFEAGVFFDVGAVAEGGVSVPAGAGCEFGVPIFHVEVAAIGWHELGDREKEKGEDGC